MHSFPKKSQIVFKWDVLRLSFVWIHKTTWWESCDAHREHKRYSVWIVKILKFSIIRSKIFLYIFSLLKLSELILSYARWCYCTFLSMICVCVVISCTCLCVLWCIEYLLYTVFQYNFDNSDKEKRKVLIL